MGPRACASAVLLGAATLFTIAAGGDTRGERPVLGAPLSPSIGGPQALRGLEGHVATFPADSVQTRELAQEYLDARQPGLAVGLVESAPESVRNDVRVRHVYARALIDEGRNQAALDAEASVVRSCGAVFDERAAAPGCDFVLLVSAIRRTDILRALVSLGVSDAKAQPEMTRMAYQNATREARVALE